MIYKPSYKWNDDERYCESCLHWDCSDQPILNVIDIFRQVSQSFKEDLYTPFSVYNTYADFDIDYDYERYKE